MLMAHGFTAEIITGLLESGVATSISERILIHGRLVEVARFKITDRGRALEG